MSKEESGRCKVHNFSYGLLWTPKTVVCSDFDVIIIRPARMLFNYPWDLLKFGNENKDGIHFYLCHISNFFSNFVLEVDFGGWLMLNCCYRKPIHLRGSYFMIWINLVGVSCEISEASHSYPTRFTIIITNLKINRSKYRFPVSAVHSFGNFFSWLWNRTKTKYSDTNSTQMRNENLHNIQPLTFTKNSIPNVNRFLDQPLVIRFSIKRYGIR